MTESRERGERLSRWQWAEIVFVALLTCTQVIVQVVLDQLLVGGLVGLILLGLLIHIATWLVPLVRSRETSVICRSGALLGRGERVWVIVCGLCVLLLGIVIAFAGSLDLMTNAYHESAPASVTWAIVLLLLGLVVVIGGNLVVQFERIRVRRKPR